MKYQIPTTIPKEYHVKLAAFSGPFEVLLSLIEQKKLPLTEIALAEVADQYLHYIKELERVEPDIIADFVVVASRLLLLKAKLLLPDAEETIEEEGEESLVRTLELYQAYRALVPWFRRRYRRGPMQFLHPSYEETFFYPPGKEVTADALATIAERMITSLSQSIARVHVILPIRYSVASRMKEILVALKERLSLRFRDLTGEAPRRMNQIVTLLGILELTKQKVVEVQQERLFEEIIIKKHT